MFLEAFALYFSFAVWHARPGTISVDIHGTHNTTTLRGWWENGMHFGSPEACTADLGVEKVRKVCS